MDEQIKLAAAAAEHAATLPHAEALAYVAEQGFKHEIEDVTTCKILAEDDSLLATFIIQAAVEEAANILDILDGNVKEVTAALEGLSSAQLQTLLDAENNGNTRKGVVSAINALLNPEQKEAPAPKRSIKDVEADLEKAEEGPTDVTNAQVISRLRAELTALQAKK